jgi:hypothetical protein
LVVPDRGLAGRQEGRRRMRRAFNQRYYEGSQLAVALHQADVFRDFVPRRVLPSERPEGRCEVDTTDRERERERERERAERETHTQPCLIVASTVEVSLLRFALI